MEKGIVTAGQISSGQITAEMIAVDHLAIGTVNIETGKTGVKHLYSDRYRELWPQGQYPEKYEEDIPC
jgi:hypothetical protein